VSVTHGEYESELVIEMMNAAHAISTEGMSEQEIFARRTVEEALLVMLRNTPANWARWEAAKALLTGLDWLSRAHRLGGRNKPALELPGEQ
jgi:hypothetical protein